MMIFKLDKFLLEDSELENKIGNPGDKFQMPVIDDFYYNDINFNCSIIDSDNNLKNYRVNDVNKFQTIFKNLEIENEKRKEDFFKKFQNHKGYLLFIIFFKEK